MRHVITTSASSTRSVSAHACAPARSCGDGVELLVECDKFVLQRRRFAELQQVAGDQRCHLLALLEGQLEMAGDPSAQPLLPGQTALLPASLGPVQLSARSQCVLLDMYLP